MTESNITFIYDDFLFSDSKPNIFLAISSNRALFFDRDFDVVKVLYGNTRVLVDVSVKKVKQKDGLNAARSIKESGSRKKTFVAVSG